MASGDFENQEHPACVSKLATRDGADNANPGQTPRPTRDNVIADVSENHSADLDQCLTDQVSPNAATREAPPGEMKKSQEIHRKEWQVEDGRLLDSWDCLKGYQAACCAAAIVSLNLDGVTSRLGNAKNCVW